MSHPSSETLPAKTTVGVVVFVVCCLLSSFRLVLDTPSPAHVGPDNIAQRSDQRFVALKTELPSRGVIGYVGESDDSALPDYYLTQYAVAPLVVDRSPNHKLVIGNFPNSHSESPSGLRLVKDFGNGVMLFTKEDAH